MLETDIIKKLLRWLALLTACLMPSLCSAVTVDLTVTGFLRGGQTLTTSGEGVGDVGAFAVTSDIGSFVGFCAKENKYLYFGRPYTYTVVEGVTAWGAARYSMLNHTVSYFKQSTPDDAVRSALEQAVIWEILEETQTQSPFSHASFTTGSFRQYSNSFPVQAAMNSLDWSQMLATPVTHTAYQLHHDIAQDLLVVTAIPEPSTWLLLSMGLMLLALVASRRGQA